MEHAKVKLTLGIGISNCHQEREIEIDWLTKEEWDELTIDEKHEQIQDDMEIFVWNYVDSGWEEI